MDAVDETDVRDPAVPAAEDLPVSRSVSRSSLPRPSSSSNSESPPASLSPSPSASLKWSTQRALNGQSDAGDKDEEEVFEWPSDMRDVVGALMARIDKLQGTVAGLREKNAEFEIRLQTEGQLRRDMEMWWGTNPREPDSRLSQPDGTGRTQATYSAEPMVERPGRTKTDPAKRWWKHLPRASSYATNDSDEEERHNRSSGRPRSTVRSSPTKCIAKLNRVDWDEFKAVRNKVKFDQMVDRFVVDVLVGDPPLTLVLPPAVGPHTPSSAVIQDSPSATQDAVAANSFPAESTPLPERIRINSKFIVDFIDKALSPTFPVENHTSIVMVSPFKVLVRFEDRIRNEFRRLSEVVENKPEGGGAVQSDVVQPDVQNEPDVAPAGQSDDGIVDVVLGDRSVSSLTSSDGEYENDDKVEKMAHFRCLLEFIDGDLKKRMDHIRGGFCERITYAELWLLFQPGDVIVWREPRNTTQACLVLGTVDPGHKTTQPFRGGRWRSNREEPNGFEVVHVTISFNGIALGPVTNRTKLLPFEGEKAITSLDIYPLAYSPIPDIRESLISSGKRFLDMTRIRHMHYTGPTSFYPPDYVDSQVIVDFEECFRQNPHWCPDIQSLVGAQVESIGVEPGDPATTQPRPCEGDCCKDEAILDEGKIDRSRNAEFMNRHIPAHRSQRSSLFIYPRSLDELEASGTEITDLEYLIMPYAVYGFVLRSRKWDGLYMKNLSPATRLDASAEPGNGKSKPPERREDAFDQLVLPPGHKDMVKSLITQHFRDKESGDREQTDIVRGKGKGLIILLHGAPGVGKTSTAECVAEYFDKPLFQITCGDLGVFAGDVESALEKHFALASRWGCILLLDEADVFLAARSPTDHLRNSLVSVFLRILEYYVGCLFLTTNRVGVFDEAFASRVHMSLYYPPLSLESTQRIFSLNLGRIEKRFQSKKVKLDVDRVAIGGFIASYWHGNPQARWNGRQIRNACQTALALAEFESDKIGDSYVTKASPNPQNTPVSLEVKHLQKVADAYLGFVEYLKDIYGVHADERAKENFLRASVKDPASMSKTPPSINPLLARRNHHQPSQSSPWNETPIPAQNFGHHGQYGSGGYPPIASFGNQAQSYAPTPGHDSGSGYGSAGNYHAPPQDSQRQRQNPGPGPYTASPYQRHSDITRQQQAGPEIMHPLDNANIPPQRGPPQDRMSVHWSFDNLMESDSVAGGVEQHGTGGGDSTGRQRNSLE
ncbi:hypothetical protein B0I37DRAFT_375764 [Chaetomium sp. MPI-CAGE-AT-0009]|nr:hypothetical protein B0I37DRAFT_375764 [Chaetomium sp. MPI-CAGE-AT-0009]